MGKVRPKKALGQHFLRDQAAAQRIVGSLTGHGGYEQLLEIGPGTGVLTRLLWPDGPYDLTVVEIDSESVVYLKDELGFPPERILEGDFLHLRADTAFPERFGLIGNLPYNISSQIFFRVLELRDRIPEMVCMIQKEVAVRLAASPGGKEYGILSVLLQAYYDIEYLFTVPPGAFHPPPKVQSGVIRLKRNATERLDCDDRAFFRIVKMGFNQRRKTLRNALKAAGQPSAFLESRFAPLRAERLSVADFVELTKLFEEAKHFVLFSAVFQFACEGIHLLS